MKRIDLVYGGWLNGPNGASSVVRLLYDNNNLFEKESVECAFYTNDLYWVQSSEQRVRISKSWKRIWRGLVKDSLSYLPTLKSIINIYRSFMLPAKRMAIRFIQDEDSKNQSPLFFHEIFTCYYYIKFTKAKRPILLTLHNNGDTFKMLRLYYPSITGTYFSKRLEKIEQKVLDRVQKICFVANNPLDNFLLLHPEISPAKVKCVYNGIPYITLRRKRKVDLDKRYKLCCVGSITSRKGQDIIVEALSQLSEKELNKIHVTFIGDGDGRKKLEEKCISSHLNKNITFAGNQSDVNKWLSESDIFILMSRDEGFPMAILEAERMGLPIISTRIAGIPEMIVDGQTGILLNPDYKELLQILKNIDSYRWEEMGAKSKALFENNFTIDRMIKGYAEVIKKLQ